MNKKILNLAFCVAAAFTAGAQMPQLTPLPLNPKVKSGVLPNGLSYYIMHNEEPKGRADFYIAQKVGSTMETENQIGFAHFLEHMAFSGTKNFPGNSLLNYLRSKGLKFGEDINAYTSYNETVYNINNVPTTDKPLMDSVLLVLHDWSCDILLEDAEIEDERGVIQEEWRLTNNASSRMYSSILPKIFKESQYQQMPIGKMEVVKNFKPEELRAYYKKWYRPDQQGIIIVGDFNTDEMEKKVLALFSSIPMPDNTPEVVHPTVSDNKEPIYASFTDPEFTSSLTTISFKSDKIPLEKRNTVEAYVNKMIFQQIIPILFSVKMSEAAKKTDCKFTGAGVNFSDYYVANTKNAFNIMVFPKHGTQAAVAEAMGIMDRICKNGFTESELEHVRNMITSQFETYYNNGAKTKNSDLGNMLCHFFIDNNPAPGIDIEYEIVKQVLPMISVQTINRVLPSLMTSENMVIVTVEPQKKGYEVVAENTLIKTVTNINLIPKSDPLFIEIPGINLKNFANSPMTVGSGSELVAKNTPVTKVSKDFPSLEIATGSLRFIDLSGRNAINAEETYAIEFEVVNSGKGAALNCLPSVNIRSGSQGISIGSMGKISVLPGRSLKVSVPVEASMNVKEGFAEFVVKVEEPNGFGTQESLLSVATHAYEPPRVVVNDYTVTSQTGSATLQKKTPFDLQLLIQNMGYGRADEVVVKIHVPQNVFIIEGEGSTRFDVLDGGQTKDLVYTLVANNNFEGESIPIQVEMREKHNRYAENKLINLQVNQPMTASRIVVEEAGETRRDEITAARLNSDVDIDIPTTSMQAENTFVVVVANENYTQVAPVPYAMNDGNIFAKYCHSTLGIPERNIRTVVNGTLNEIKRNIDWLCKVGKTFGDKANLILYYSGHGIPDETTAQAFLMPIDGYHSEMSTNIPVNELYKMLNSSGAGRIVVFMDACFSGSRRGDGMLMAARGVQLKAKTEAPLKNMIVFSAAQGDETAYPLDKQNHGLFTYYLLKKLKETGGKVSLGELTDYVSDEVKKVSLLENSKIQTPQVQISPEMADSWRQINLAR